MKLIEEGFLKRNRKVLIISLAIFLAFAIAGAIIAFIKVGSDYGMISKAINTTSINQTDSNTGLKTLDIFAHNLIADAITIIGGVLFSVISVLIVAFNAFTIGAPLGADFGFFGPTILPHGIIEYLASVFSLAAAFKITKLEIRMIKTRSFKSTLKEHKTELKDILVMIIVVVILLLIAAFIECNITWIIAKWCLGI